MFDVCCLSAVRCCSLLFVVVRCLTRVACFVFVVCCAVLFVVCWRSVFVVCCPLFVCGWLFVVC